MNASRNRLEGSLRSATSTPGRVILNVMRMSTNNCFGVCVLLLAFSLFGCNPRGSESEAGQKDSDANSAEIKKTRGELAELESEIEAKQKELKRLRERANTLRTKLTASSPATGKVHRSIQSLFAGMPKDSYPKHGKAASIERSVANKWCSKHLVGQEFEWQEEIVDAEVELDEKSGRFFVYLNMVTPPDDANFTYKSFEKIELGGAKWNVFANDFVNEWLGFSNRHHYLIFPECTADEAKEIREITGKVTCRAKIKEAKFVEQGGRSMPYLSLTFSSLRMNGIQSRAGDAR